MEGNNGRFKKGHVISPEIRAKLVEAKKRNPSQTMFKKGHVMSPETILKLKEAKQRNPSQTVFKKGHVMPEEVRVKISETMKNNPDTGKHMIGKKGAEAHYYKNGSTPFNRKIRTTKEYVEWRKAVFERDNWTCQNENCVFCWNKKGGELHPHHIRKITEFPEGVFCVDNGLTLCKEYHVKGGVHKKMKEV